MKKLDRERSFEDSMAEKTEDSGSEKSGLTATSGLTLTAGNLQIYGEQNSV